MDSSFFLGGDTCITKFSNSEVLSGPLYLLVGPSIVEE
jgi:hypothetical protein